jgi:hypothetical protein
VFQDEDYGEDFEFESYPPDPKTQEAKKLLLNEFEENPNKVYYQRQLEVWYEKNFYHWVTDRAIRELKDEGKITAGYYPVTVGEYEDKLKIITLASNRYFKRAAKNVARLVEEYCDPDIAKDIGLFGQEMFKVAYARHGYKLIKEDATEFDGKTWGRSEKNLDFIVEKHGLFLGCEVKNTLRYIPKDELDEKMEMCLFFGIIPIFIVRYSPTVWNFEIYKKGGLVQIFEKQIYPPGRGRLVNRLREELNLPVLTSERVPDSIMERLDRVIGERSIK